jgi:predicted AAA+ superfamily ATPase
MIEIKRPAEQQRLLHLLTHFPVVALLGARQVGKSTLARQLAAERPSHWFDLEDPAGLARLVDPALTLSPLQGLVVLDEVQRLPELFPLLRVLADRPGRPATFLLLGSASPDLLRQGSETLAGRMATHELGGFALDETGMAHMDRLWLRGGFPRSFLADTDSLSLEWREHFVRTFLERDLPQLGITVPAPVLRRFWAMLAHWHGQVWNAAEFARAFGLGNTTVRRYLDLLSAALVIRQLQPWHENIAKRQVKAPKIYLNDSGLLHTLLGLGTREQLDNHPRSGASWEGFAIQAVIRRLGVRPEECWFWATHAGAEMDLLVIRGGRRLGFEIKRTTAPRTTRSMHSARESLKLDSLTVIHAGEHAFPLAEGIHALPVTRILEDLDPLE